MLVAIPIPLIQSQMHPHNHSHLEYHHLKIKEKVGDPLRIEEEINDGDRHCEMGCKYIEYKPGSKGRAGLAFNTDSPVDFSGAKRVTFFLMGDKGGETVKVEIPGKSDAAR